MIVPVRAKADIGQPPVHAILCSLVMSAFGRAHALDRRLSTAILRGLDLPAQAVLPVEPDGSLNLAASALGAAWRGYGWPAEELGNVLYVLDHLSRESNVDLLATFIAHPVTGLPMSLGGVIVSLGIPYSWSHTQIAAWLRACGY